MANQDKRSPLGRVLDAATVAIAEPVRPNMGEKAKEALGIELYPLPEGVYWSPQREDFFSEIDGARMGDEFFVLWHDRYKEFPRPSDQEQQDERHRQAEANGDIPDVVDAEALAAVLYDFSHLGPSTEFTDRRKERLRQDMEEIKAEVAKIDAEITYLNERRTNAMLAYSGISADLTAMDK